MFDDKKTLSDIIPPGVIDAIQPLVDAFEDVKKEGMAMWVDLSAIFDELQKAFGVSGQDAGIQWADTFKLIFQIVRLVMLATLRVIADTIKGIRVILENPGVQFALITIQTAFRVMYEVVAGIVETLIAVFNNDFGKIPGILNTRMAAITDIFEAFDVYFYAQCDALVVFLGGIWDEIYYTIMGQLELIIMDIGIWIMGVQTTIINGWNAIVAGVMFVINNFGDLVIQYFANFAFNIGTAIRVIGEIIVGSFKLTWAAVLFLFNDAIPLITRSLITLGASIDRWLKTTGDSIAKGFQDGWSRVVKMWANAWPDTLAALSTFTADFTKWLGTTWATLKASFAKIWDGKTVGQSVGTGILDGIKANIGAIVTYMTKLGASIIDAFIKGLTVKTEDTTTTDTTTPKTATGQTVKSGQSQIDAKVEAITKTLGATATAAVFGATRGAVTNIYNNSNATAYNLGVNTTASAGDTMQSFAIMGALAS
jgi:hypothetical protein